MTQATIKYQNWLRSLIDWSDSSFDLIFSLGWETFFTFFIPNDDNRASDGLRLRDMFEADFGLRLPYLGECRIIEMLIGLAIRLNEITYDYTNPNQTPYWFCMLVENLQLIENTNSDGDILDVFIRLNDRKYDPDGSNGGLFPLKNPREDQRFVEIWYQMMAFLQENM